MRVRYICKLYSILQAEIFKDGVRLYYISRGQSGAYNGFGGKLRIGCLHVITGSDFNDCTLIDNLLTKGYADISEYTVEERTL